MITLEKLAIFEHFNGDYDGWARVYGRKKDPVMTDQDWREIDFILQDLTSLKNGLCAAGYASDIRRRLKEMSASDEVEKKLMALA